MLAFGYVQTAITHPRGTVGQMNGRLCCDAATFVQVRYCKRLQYERIGSRRNPRMEPAAAMLEPDFVNKG